MDGTKPYANLKITRKGAEAEIEGELTVLGLVSYETEALEKAQQSFEMQGFRKGQVPLDIVKRHVGTAYLLEDAAGFALEDSYDAIIADSKLKPIGHPHVAITKLAPGNPVTFRVRVALQPEFSLPDYKKIGVAIKAAEKPVVVADSEVDQTIAQIMALRKKDPKEETPALTDEFARSLGAFTGVADLRTKVRESIAEEKEMEARRAHREAIAGQLIAQTNMTIPALLVEEELANAVSSREEHVKRAGITMEEYLKRMKATAEELDAKEREYLERQLKTKFIFERIAEAEHLEADPDDVEKNLTTLRDRYADADPERLRAYVIDLLVNEKVLELLEGGEGARPLTAKMNPNAVFSAATPSPDRIPPQGAFADKPVPFPGPSPAQTPTSGASFSAHVPAPAQTSAGKPVVKPMPEPAVVPKPGPMQTLPHEVPPSKASADTSAARFAGKPAPMPTPPPKPEHPVEHPAPETK